MLIKSSLMPAVGGLMNPLYMIVTLITLGNCPDNTINQASFSLATLFLNLLVNSFSTSFTVPAATYFAQASDDKKLLGLYYRRQILLSSLFFIPFALLTLGVK